MSSGSKAACLLHALVSIALAALMNGCATHIMPTTSVHEPVETEKTPEIFAYDHFSRVLELYVDTEGLVDYAGLQRNSYDLDMFYEQVARYSPDSHPGLFPRTADRLAYWINGYNATVIKAVLAYYPIATVTDVRAPWYLAFLPSRSGFFLLQKLTYGGKQTSFYYLENGVIRKRFTDPRIHFALNCASLGCPTLPQIPFLPEKLEEQLDSETRKFINNNKYVSIDAENNTIYLSSIFKWYQEDFIEHIQREEPSLTDNEALLAYILPYLEDDRRAVLTSIMDRASVRFLAYDWGLNDQNGERTEK